VSPGWGVAIGGRHRAVWLDGEPGKPVGDLDLDGDGATRGTGQCAKGYSGE